MIERMAGLFLAHAERMLDLVIESCGTGNLEEVRRAAHSLKSSAANLGARQLEGLARAVEQAAAEKNARAIEPLLVDLQAAFGRVRTRLDEERSGIAG